MIHLFIHLFFVEFMGMLKGYTITDSALGLLILLLIDFFTISHSLYVFLTAEEILHESEQSMHV